METPFLVRIYRCLEPQLETEVEPSIRAMKSRLRDMFPQYRKVIASSSAKGRLADALSHNLRDTVQHVQNHLLVIITDHYCLTDVEQVLNQLVETRRVYAASPNRGFHVVLFANSPNSFLTEELLAAVDQFIPYPTGELLRHLPSLQDAITNAIEGNPAPKTEGQPVPMRKSSSHAQLYDDPTRPIPPETIKHERVQTPAAPAPDTPEYLKEHISPVTFRYQPLPNRASDPEPQWWYPENIESVIEGVKAGSQQWIMAAASRRGLSHWHKNAHRDDAYALDTNRFWNILAVADGAGSARLSRVTANESTKIAVETIKRYVPATNHQDKADYKSLIDKAIRAAISDVYDYQEGFLRKNQLDKRDTYCTLLILVHQPFDDGNCLFGVFHVGDGYMMAASPQLHRAAPISQGDHGSVSNEALFVTNFTKKELMDRVRVEQSPAPIEMFFLVTDGIEDDMKPSPKQAEKGGTKDKNFEQFGVSLKQEHLIWPDYRDWGAILDWVISYERKGSYDDRTIAVLTTQPNNPAFR